jgi:hypothetical protein
MAFKPEVLDQLTSEQIADFKERAIQNQRASTLRAEDSSSHIRLNPKN